MSTPIILIAEELSPAGIAQLESDFEIRYTDGADRAQLLPALADADAVIVRSATTIDAEALEHAPRLRVVARAGGWVAGGWGGAVPRSAATDRRESARPPARSPAAAH